MTSPSRPVPRRLAPRALLGGATIGLLFVILLGGLAGGRADVRGSVRASVVVAGLHGDPRAVVGWAVAHAGLFTYALGPPTDRGGSVEDMQGRRPASSTCDCSMYVRWAMAQVGIDAGLTTVTQWTANGLLPDSETARETPLVARGVGGSPPPGGYRPGDIVFFGHGAGSRGHDALWLGDGLIVHCSSSGGGSNIRPLAGYVRATGWLRWRLRA